MIYQAYKLKNTNKMLRIIKDSVGWYYIAKLPKDRDNLFSSIEEIELVLNIELEKPPYWSKEV